jgi:cysteine peptidase C11 family protein
VYFVWETGLMETIEDIVTLGLRRERGTGATDAAIEAAARRGRVIWEQMKQSAENTVAADGGARLLAESAGRLWNELKGNVEFHALGHSAGSIVLAYFLPLLVAQKPRSAPPVGLRTLHFLAPAITTALFKKHLKGLIGAGKPIAQLTMYTMTDQLERADRSLRLYRKSLLYLVRGAFESEAPTPILGLQESLNRDLELIRFFGLAGREKVADVIYSKSPQTAALADRSESATHGGFDNDVATMTSVARRVLGVPAAPVVDYFEEAIPGFDRVPVGSPAADAAPRSRAAIRQGRKPWTVMVWMAGDNDLEKFGTGDLHELKRIDASDEANVVVQLDRMRDHETRRYRLQRGTPLERDVVARLGETNTGDPRVAVDFFRWAIQEYPAERLLAVIWNHGSGIDDTNVYERGTEVRRRRRPLFQTTAALARRDRAIAFDDTSHDFLDNLELKRVLAAVKRQTGRTIDVLGFDACLMNMIEVAYQLRGTARLVVGSEEVEPTDGWPYDRVLEAIVANPRLSNVALGFAIADEFVRSYSGENVTQSALDLSKLETVVGCIDRLSKALTAAMRQPAEQVAITRTLNAVQRFDTPDYVDLGHFCAGLLARSRAASVKAAAKATIASLSADDGFVAAERHKGGGVRHASGVAIYFPGGPVSKVYSKLDFARTTGWGRFLEAYHRA